MQSTPPSLRTKAARLAASKCALLARVDAYGQDPSGQVGALGNVIRIGSRASTAPPD
jgi:U4/U6 small nuclear ribonucleoprotein PRP31